MKIVTEPKNAPSKMKSGNVNLRHGQVSDILKECQKTRDLVIVCRDGQLTCNSFIFSAVFRGFNRILDSSGDDTKAVVIPELCIQWLHEFFEGVYNQRSKISYNSAIQFLLNWREPDYAKETVKYDFLEADLVKQETSDYEADITEDWTADDDLTEKQEPVKISLKSNLEDPDFNIDSESDPEDINLAERKKNLKKTRSKVLLKMVKLRVRKENMREKLKLGN